jgi:hypothetical protein
MGEGDGESVEEQKAGLLSYSIVVEADRNTS